VLIISRNKVRERVDIDDLQGGDDEKKGRENELERGMNAE